MTPSGAKGSFGGLHRQVLGQAPDRTAERRGRPNRFKTPGTNVNIGPRGDIFVFTEEQRHELMRVNREFLSDPSTLVVDEGQEHNGNLALPQESQIGTVEPVQLTNGDAPSS
jgi:hypothetical protein